MKFLSYEYNDINPSIDLSEFCSRDDLLFFDIETTGLSPSTAFIYLIGAGYYSDSGFTVIQWFADNALEESIIINEFFNFAESYTTIIHFNGQKFDIPFVEKRCIKHKIPCSISSMKSVDIYRLIKPYKSILGLPDLRQKTIEDFLQISRDDIYNGGELIPVYKKYTMNPDNELLNLLLLHNKEDVFNMTKLLLILNYRNITNACFNFNKIKENKYKDYNGNNCIEVLLSGTHDFTCHTHIKTIQNNIYLSISPNGNFNIRIPIINDELKHYFADYKNYYYLTYEDYAIHKSVASGVPKENRKNATKNNCYIKSVNSFIQFYDSDSIITFKKDIKSKEYYCTYEDFKALTDEQYSLYTKELIKYLVHKI